MCDEFSRDVLHEAGLEGVLASDHSCVVIDSSGTKGQFDDGTVITFLRKVCDSTPQVDAIGVDGSQILTKGEGFCVERYGCNLSEGSLVLGPLCLRDNKAAGRKLSVSTGNLINVQRMGTAVSLCERIVGGIAGLATLPIGLFGTTVKIAGLEPNRTTVSMQGPTESLRLTGDWRAGCLNGKAEGTVTSKTGGYIIRSDWDDGILKEVMLKPPASSSLKQISFSRGATKLTNFGTSFVTFDVRGISSRFQELLDASDDFQRKAEDVCASAVSGVMAATLEKLRVELEDALIRGVSSRVATVLQGIAACGAERFLASELIKKSADQSQKQITESLLFESSRLAEQRSEVSETRESIRSLMGDIEPRSLRVSDVTRGCLKTKSDQEAHARSLEEAKLSTLSKVDEVERLASLKATQATEIARLRSLYDELCARRDRQRVALRELREDAQPVEKEVVSEITHLVQRVKDLEKLVGESKNRSVLCGMSGPKFEKDAPTPHCLLRTKKSQSLIGQLEKQIVGFESIKSDLEKKKTALMASVFPSADEDENEPALVMLEDELFRLRQIDAEISHECERAEERHIRSLQNFKDRTQAVSDRVHELTLRIDALKTPEISSRVRVLHAALLERHRLENAVKESIRTTSSTAGFPRDALPDLQALRDQIAEAKRVGRETEDETSALAAEVRSLSDRQREREERLVAKKVCDGDERVAILQKEVDRRDATIAKLRSELQRVRQLEAKLLTTKNSVSVQRHTSLHNAQLAAAVSAAQIKTEDTLWFARTAGRNISKGL